jgi:hypothetical protein
MPHAIIWGKNGRRHEVDFGDAPIESALFDASRKVDLQRMTHRWREMDSNHRYRITNNLFWLPPFGPAIRLSQQKPALSCRGPMVRIHLPPAASLLQTCPQHANQGIDHRSRLLWHVGCLWAGRRRGINRHNSPGARSWRQFSRHIGQLRQRPQSSLDWRSDPRPQA